MPKLGRKILVVTGAVTAALTGLSLNTADASIYTPVVTAAAYTVTDYPLVSGMANPYGIVTGPTGDLWFSECQTSVCSGSGIGSITPAGTVTSYSVRPGTPGWGTDGLTVGPDSAIWFTQGGGSGYIGRITASGQVSYPDPMVSNPGAITTGPDGNLWFTALAWGTPGPGYIGMLTTAGAATTYANQGIDSPMGIVTGPDGNLWFTNEGDNTIGRITPAGVVTDFGGTDISKPMDITSGPDGALWFTNAGSNSIGRITTGGAVTNYTGVGIDHPRGITSDGTSLWFTNWGSRAIGEITTAGVVSSYSSYKIHKAGMIIAEPDGDLWFANLGNASIGWLHWNATK